MYTVEENKVRLKHNFRELKVWKQSLELSKKIFPIIQSFPNHERYNLASQIMRSAISIPSNIAEGSSRNTNKDFSRFLDIAIGSSYELETQLLLAKEFNYLDEQNFKILSDNLIEIQKMLNAFQSNLIL